MIETEVLRLNDMSVHELKEMWKHYFDSEPIWKTKRFYIPRLAYRMQELEYGGVPEHIRELLLGKTVSKHEETETGHLPPNRIIAIKTTNSTFISCIVSGKATMIWSKSALKTRRSARLRKSPTKSSTPKKATPCLMKMW
jgi:hypothetical protein